MPDRWELAHEPSDNVSIRHSNTTPGERYGASLVFHRLASLQEYSEP